MGQAENKLIEELLGQADYMAMEMALLRVRHQLAEEEAAELRARTAWLQRLLRVIAGTRVLDPERLVLAVAISAYGTFELGEVTVLDAETLREPFGARRPAPPGAVELLGHDLAAAEARSRELTGGSSPPGLPASAVPAERASTTDEMEARSSRSGRSGSPRRGPLRWPRRRRP